jgi:hypothetical protein
MIKSHFEQTLALLMRWRCDDCEGEGCGTCNFTGYKPREKLNDRRASKVNRKRSVANRPESSKRKPVQRGAKVSKKVLLQIVRR